MDERIYIRFSDCACDLDAPGRPVAHKSEVVRYLRSGELGVMDAGWMTDQFTGELVKGCCDHGRSDDSYRWGESLAYYLDKYNIELPADFLAHIYEKLGISGPHKA